MTTPNYPGTPEDPFDKAPREDAASGDAQGRHSAEELTAPISGTVPPVVPPATPAADQTHEMGYWEQRAWEQQHPGQKYGAPPQPPAYGTQPYPDQPYGTPSYGSAVPPVPPAPAQTPYAAPPAYDASQGYAAPSYYAGTQPTPGKATASMVIGIVALASILLCGIGLIAAPVGLFLGYSARREIAESNGRLGGSGTATAGIVMGWIGTVLLVLGIIAFIALIAIGVSTDNSATTTYGNAIGL